MTVPFSDTHTGGVVTHSFDGLKEVDTIQNSGNTAKSSPKASPIALPGPNFRAPI